MSKINTARSNDDLIKRDDLIAYVLGAADEATHSRVEQSPIWRHAAHTLAAQLYRVVCPTVPMLVDYAEQRLAATERLVLAQHIAVCPACQQELATIAAIHAVPFSMPTRPSLFGWLRPLIEAVAQPAPALGVLGQQTTYTTPRLTMNLLTDKHPGPPPTWTLFGDVRTATHVLAVGTVQAVRVQQMEHADAPLIAGAVDDGCSLTIADLPAGIYHVSLLTNEDEVVIAPFSVGIGS